MRSAIAIGLLGSFTSLIHSESKIKPQQWVLEMFPVFSFLFHFLEANVSLHFCIEWQVQLGSVVLFYDKSSTYKILKFFF